MTSEIKSASSSALALAPELRLECSGCNQKKGAVTCFSKEQRRRRQSTKTKPNGNKGYCRDCVRNKNQLRRYGLSTIDVQIKLQVQRGKCAMPFCGYTIDMDTLQIDHDHDTGVVRGLLCKKCNTSIGGLRDRVHTVLASAVYLSRSKNTVSAEVHASLIKDMKTLNDWMKTLTVVGAPTGK